MIDSAILAPLSFSIASRNRASPLSFVSRSNLLCRNSTKSIICALLSPYGDFSTIDHLQSRLTSFIKFDENLVKGVPTISLNYVGMLESDEVSNPKILT
ncbi:hypothetical protein CsSME_00047596 [Camellia sinensis var. sinensis]